MRSFVINVEDGQLGEAVEFSNGEVVVSWTAGPTSRFPNYAVLRDAMAPTATFDPVRPEPLADRLRRARKAAGLSQRGLSRETGVSFSTISRIEAGNNYVSNQTLENWLEDHI